MPGASRALSVDEVTMRNASERSTDPLRHPVPFARRSSPSARGATWAHHDDVLHAFPHRRQVRPRDRRHAPICEPIAISLNVTRA